MKVLFVVNDESISASIVKKYQKQYKEIISYKNVYYFNAIIKELQKNRTYDRIVISEDLDEITSLNVYQKDKILFDKLDSISDEAVNSAGKDIPIILICNDRRNAGEEILIKIFGIGIYNAIIGQDRTTDMVCQLINKPRSKKEAKNYYKIDTESVNYEKEKDNYVSEVEIQNVLRHFKKIIGDNQRITDSFKQIVSQYNNEQLKVIVAVLPNDVKKVLEEESPEYQEIAIKKGTNQSNVTKKKDNKIIEGTSERLLEVEPNRRLSKQVVVPTTIDKSLYKKVEKVNKDELENKDIDEFEFNEEDIEHKVESMLEEKTKKVGRSKKEKELESNTENKVAKKRGRPRKNIVNEELNILPGLDDDIFNENEKNNDILSNMQVKKNNDINFEENYYEDDDVDERQIKSNRLSNIGIPNKRILTQNYEEDEEDEDDYDEDDYEKPINGTKLKNDRLSNEEIKSKNNMSIDYEEDEEDEEENYDDNVSKIQNNEKNDDRFINNKELEIGEDELNNSVNQGNYNNIQKTIQKYDNQNSLKDEEFENLIIGDKKIVCFVGTSKNGTSFIVNNIAQVLSNMGIDTAILDTTKNRNSYYTYTNDDEELRQIAFNSINNLANGIANGIRINNCLTIYSGVPSKQEEITNSYPIMETLLKRHSIILIDCDFETPTDYFDKSQEIYLIQSLDVLTIQPLTEFLRMLQLKNINFENKIRIILNKFLKVKGGSSKTFVKGMSKYNNEDLSLMKDLFNADQVKIAAEIPFDEDVYIKYLESLIDCEIRINSYPKEFKQKLNNLANVIYPLLPGKKEFNKRKQKNGYNSYTNSFSAGMNNTLDNMRKKY